MELYERLHHNLEYLKLDRVSEIIDNYLERASKENTSVIEAIDFLLEEQKRAKAEMAFKMSTQIAGFPFKKTLEQFDFSFQPSIDQKMIAELQTMRFIHNAENLALLGPPGVGKTHIAISLGIEAIKNRLSVYYITCHELLNQLTRAHQENRLKRKLKTLTKHKLLIIDEVGYLPFDKLAANLFFQLISDKYENSSIIITSNKNFPEWGDVLGDNVLAGAILDRFLHHCTVISVKGQSYRLKERLHRNEK